MNKGVKKITCNHYHEKYVILNKNCLRYTDLSVLPFHDEMQSCLEIDVLQIHICPSNMH